MYQSVRAAVNWISRRWLVSGGFIKGVRSAIRPFRGARIPGLFGVHTTMRPNKVHPPGWSRVKALCLYGVSRHDEEEWMERMTD
jgi:hypothetical protein